MKVALTCIAIALAVDALPWLLVALATGAWPRSRPIIAWPFIWFRRHALKPRGRFM